MCAIKGVGASGICRAQEKFKPCFTCGVCIDIGPDHARSPGAVIRSICYIFGIAKRTPEPRISRLVESLRAGTDHHRECEKKAKGEDD